jgi:hypothetical protein
MNGRRNGKDAAAPSEDVVAPGGEDGRREPNIGVC